MYDKFQSCTVDVQVGTLILITLEETLCYIHTLCTSLMCAIWLCIILV